MTTSTGQRVLSHDNIHKTLPPVLLWEKYVVVWMLSCDRTRCPLNVAMSQDTLPLLYYGKRMLSYGCCHVIGHVVLWMLSCNRTLPPVLLLLKT